MPVVIAFLLYLEGWEMSLDSGVFKFVWLESLRTFVQIQEGYNNWWGIYIDVDSIVVTNLALVKFFYTEIGLFFAFISPVVQRLSHYNVPSFVNYYGTF